MKKKNRLEDWKAIGKKILFPPMWFMFLLTVGSTLLLVTVFMKGWENSPVAYISYVLAFYALTVVCIACSRTFPGCYRNIREKIFNTKFGNRYMTDVVFKIHVSLYRSLAINLLYVVANLFWGIHYETAWFIIFAFYYSILAVMRFLLLRYTGHNEMGKNRLDEQRRVRICAIILLLVNFVLSGAVLMILYQNRGFDYYGVLIYVMALYTFYSTAAAIADIVKYRKYQSPVMSMTKVINLAAALVSVLALETAMLSQFGAETSLQNRRIMIAATGGGVSIIIVAMATYTIVSATREIRKGREN